MKDIFAKCGYNCGRCASYRDNLRTRADRRRCSDGWYKYFGFRLSPEKLIACDGCQAKDSENTKRYYKLGCRVRKCAVANGAFTCAHCSAYPCEDVVSFSSPHTREKVEERLQRPVPEEDYLAFIKPYEGTRHLDSIHRSLTKKDMVKMTRVSSRPRTVPFPEDLRLPEKDRTAFRKLHRILSDIGSANGISYARRQVLKKRRDHLLRILWVFAAHGNPGKQRPIHLEVDGGTYLAQHIHSGYSVLKGHFKTLKTYGIRCEHVPLHKDGWLTPKGALRAKGWYMTISFDREAGGAAGLRALREYATQLEKKYGKDAFRYFSRADMRILARRDRRHNR